MNHQIINYNGIIVGSVELPDDYTAEQVTAVLDVYRQPPKSMLDIQKEQIRATNEEKIKFCEQLLLELKEKNIVDGINAAQALWVHHRMRALNVDFYGLPMVVDISNMFLSGDIETACIALLHCSPDDMSAPYHFFSVERRDWIVGKIKAWLGWS